MTRIDTHEPTLSNSPTVGMVLRRNAHAHPDKPLLIHDAERLTYGDAERRSSRLARGLVALGAGKGTHVGLLYPNGAQFVVGMLAAARIGAVVVPLSIFGTAGELREQMVHSDIHMLLGTASHHSHDYVQRLAEVPAGAEFDAVGRLYCADVPQLRLVAIDGGSAHSSYVRDTGDLDRHAGTVDDELFDALEDDVHGSDPLAIVYTSGSTGGFAGVVHTHAGLLNHQRDLNEFRGLTADDILFRDAPFFRIGGFAFGLLAALVAGSTLLCPSMPAERQAADQPDVPGTAEAGSVVLLSGDQSEQPEPDEGSSGTPGPGLQTRIVDPDTGAPVAVGEIGELCFRGPSVMQGYYRRSREQSFDPDGWFHTGNPARTDGEFVHFADWGDANLAPVAAEKVFDA
ncbi:long-chain fatty acid--CoA ligase [Nocardia vinacea]|uniref:Long-chain fatty acid--CoA ligase n=1 Tax=Nocardia vinacea TaxID=96468 RepID=A0ABZ1YSG8_9NOCA